jgi:hypothetical protein
MSEEARPTPIPWLWTYSGPVMSGKYHQPIAIAQYDAENLIAGCFGDVKGGEPVAIANAKLIVRAVNCHEELVAALKEITECAEHWKHWADYDRRPEALLRARTALAKAEKDL